MTLIVRPSMLSTLTALARHTQLHILATVTNDAMQRYITSISLSIRL
jgi:hypothetical protein